MSDRLVMTYADRAEIAESEMASRLLTLMSEKKSNLCVSLDVTDPERFLTLAAGLGPHIAVLKTHIDTLENFSSKITVELTSLARENDFIIFEDRKFADIGNTVKNQYTKGAFHIVEWADIVNAHGISGPGIIQGLRDEVERYGLENQRGMLLLAQMSTKGSLATDSYTKKIVEMAETNRDFVMGFIGAGEKLSSLASATCPGMIIMVPGVKIAEGGDSFHQKYSTPERMVAEGADVIIVGRDIIDDPKPIAKAKKYRDIAWDSLQKRVTQPKVKKK